MCRVHGLSGEHHCPGHWEGRLYTNCYKGKAGDGVVARVIGGEWSLIFVCLIGRELSLFTGQGVSKQCSMGLVLEKVEEGRRGLRKKT